MPDPQQREASGSLTAAISTAVVRIMREYTGRGPTRARTSIRDNVVVVMLSDTMLKAERSLVEDGKSEVVLTMRKEFQMTMRGELSAAVEMLTERRVIAFMSANHIDPDYAVEVFVLAPGAAGDDPDPPAQGESATSGNEYQAGG
jgi:uncharacterized protein YbcI